MYCTEYCKQMKKYWPSDVTLNHKLYKTKGELQTMVEAITGTDLVLNQRRTMNNGRGYHRSRFAGVISILRAQEEVTEEGLMFKCT